MLRSRTRRTSLFDGSFDGRREPILGVKCLGAIVVAALAIPVLFFVGEYVQRVVIYRGERQIGPSREKVPTRALRDLTLNTLYEVPMPRRNRKLLQTGLPVYDLRISSKDLKSLQDTAELVSARSTAAGITREYVPARFLVDGQWLPIDVKLRGAMAYHYLKKRPSLRLKFRKDRLFQRKREINLIEPYDKGLTIELTSSWEMAQHGLLTLESQFVILRLNGEVLGLFQEYEHFGRSLADRSGRPEGYIFSGAGQLYGKPGPAYDKAARAIALVTDCYPAAENNLGSHCLDWKFVDDYFDTDKLAWASALMTLLHSRHGWAPDNLRLFWDPARGKFEPIPWDYAFYRIDRQRTPDGETDVSGYLAESLFRIPRFRQMRDKRIWTLLTQRVDKMIDHSNKMFESMRDVLALDIRHLSLESDERDQSDYVEGLNSNAEFLKELFASNTLKVDCTDGNNGQLNLELLNWGKSYLRVTEVELAAGNRSTVVALDHPVVVDGLWQDTPGRTRFSVSSADGARVVNLKVRNEITGAVLTGQEIQIRQVDELGPREPAVAEPVGDIAVENVENVRLEGSRVVFGPGDVKLTERLEIPASLKVVFQPGLRLEMGQDTSLVVYGDLTSMGTEAAPIRIFGRSEQPWGGLFIQGTRTKPAKVDLRHTIVEGGAGGQTQRTIFTAPFAVHDGTVVIESSEFRNSVADDAVNIKYARLKYRNNQITGAKDDALDCDFCTGDVTGNRVADSQGDALDFSGSDMRVMNNVVENCGDKGLSIGENSAVVIENNTVTGCYTGIAVKDLSDATIRNARLSGLQIGIALYIKKPTFGPSSARVENVAMHDVATQFLRDPTCTLQVNSTEHAGQETRPSDRLMEAATH